MINVSSLIQLDNQSIEWQEVIQVIWQESDSQLCTSTCLADKVFVVNVSVELFWVFSNTSLLKGDLKI